MKTDTKPKEKIGVDALTGQPIYREDEKNGLCPSCNKHGVISDMPSSERCLICGWEG